MYKDVGISSPNFLFKLQAYKKEANPYRVVACLSNAKLRSYLAWQVVFM